MTTSQDEPDREQEAEGREVPQHPEGRQTETVDALEDRQGDAATGDDDRVVGDDVTQNPDTDEMEGLPGPPQGEPGEPAG